MPHLTSLVVYRIDPGALIMCGVFAKKALAALRALFELSRSRFGAYDAMASGNR